MARSGPRRRRWPLLSLKIGAIVALAVFVSDQLHEPIRRAFQVPRTPPFASKWLEQSRLGGRLLGLLTVRANAGEAEFQRGADELARELAPSGASYFIVAQDGQVLYTPPDLANLPLGGRLGLDVLPATVDGDPVGFGVIEPMPLWRDDELLGVAGIVRMLFGVKSLPATALPQLDPPRVLEIAPGSLLASFRPVLAQEIEDLRTGTTSTKRRARAVLAVLVALVAGATAALLVTRRIRRLAHQATVGSDDAVPGPFKDTGHDEIGELASVLTAMRERSLELVQGLRETDRKRREWIAQLSHDFRTPLGALGIALDRAGTALSAGDTARAARSLESAGYDVRRLRTLLADMLELGRLELYDGLHLEPVLLGELVSSAVTAVHPIAQDRGVNLVSAPPAHDPLGVDGEIHADGSRLLRALENLLTNALRASATRVEVSLVLSEERVQLVVEDDGPGFELDPAAATVPLDAWLAAHPESRGLGLRVADRVARAHDGRAWLSNRAPTGARVVLELPRRTPAR